MRPRRWRTATLAAATTVLAITGFAPAPVAGQVQQGIFVGPPVPAASLPYSVRVVGSTTSAPITVTNITIDVNGQFVDVTFFIDHGLPFTVPVLYEGTRAGPPLAAGTYVFRVFTRDRFPGQTEYPPAAQPQYTLTVIVTPTANVAEAIEYYYPLLNHYFLTASPVEIAGLDAGVFPGWIRTGEKLPGVYSTDPSTGGVQAPVSPVCRFYGLPSAGLDTHFFSASPAECAAVEAKWPDIWLLETPTAFYVYLPNTTDGSCPDGTVPVYRLYNNRPDVNHRYTTSLAIRQQMIDQLWITEGYGPLAVVMCVNGS